MFHILVYFCQKKKKTKNNEIEANFRFVVIIFNNWSILYFSDSPFKLLQQRLKTSGQVFYNCFMKCCWQSVSQVMVQCLYSCDLLRTNWKYKWPNINFGLMLVLTCLCLCYAYACAYAYALLRTSFSFSPVVIDSLIDCTQLFTFNLYWLTFRIIARKKVLYTKILQ